MTSLSGVSLPRISDSHEAVKVRNNILPLQGAGPFAVYGGVARHGDSLHVSQDGIFVPLASAIEVTWDRVDVRCPPHSRHSSVTGASGGTRPESIAARSIGSSSVASISCAVPSPDCEAGRHEARSPGLLHPATLARGIAADASFSR